MDIAALIAPRKPVTLSAWPRGSRYQRSYVTVPTRCPEQARFAA